MNKNKKKREVRVEYRPLAGEIIKPEKMRVDAWAIVEVKSGLTLRWATSLKSAEKMKGEFER